MRLLSNDQFRGTSRNGVTIDRRLLREPQDPFADDVTLDLVGTARDRLLGHRHQASATSAGSGPAGGPPRPRCGPRAAACDDLRRVAQRPLGSGGRPAHGLHGALHRPLVSRWASTANRRTVVRPFPRSDRGSARPALWIPAVRLEVLLRLGLRLPHGAAGRSSHEVRQRCRDARAGS
jgi:hypothetical protein